MTKREIVKEIRSFSSRLCLRANNVWAVSKDGSSLFLYKLHKNESSWTYTRFSEEDFGNDVSCPIGYLELTDTKNVEWRERVRQHYEPTLLVNEIKKKFRKKKTGRFVIHTTSEKVPDLVMVSASPFQGRYEGVLYNIPTAKVKGYTYEHD